MLGWLHLSLRVLLLCCVFDVHDGTKCELIQQKIRPVNKFVALLGFSVCHSTSHAVRGGTTAILFRKHHFSSTCAGALTQKVTSPTSSCGRQQCNYTEPRYGLVQWECPYKIWGAQSTGGYKILKTPQMGIRRGIQYACYFTLTVYK